MSSVLVVTVPSALDGDLYQMRDYVRESLELGVLIVGKGVQWESRPFAFIIHEKDKLCN